MRNKFLQPGEQRAAKVADLFAQVAPRYDLINDLQSFFLHRWWKRKVIRLANVRSGSRALDVCCGTGDISFAMAARGAEVVGLDFSEAMLAVAKTKVTAKSNGKERAGLRLQFISGDAQALPFPENSFDAVTVGYGLRNLSSWERGLEEMHRVAKPGGRIIVLDFGKPDNALWRGVYFAYLKSIVPIFGRLFCGDAQTHAYILESLLVYPAQRGVAEKMRALGFRDVRILSLIGGAMSINYGVK